MLRRLIDRLVGLSRRLVVRVVLIASLGALAVLAAKLTSRFVWDGAAEAIGARALNRLLDIIATSMLAVTTFSLTVMLTVHRGAAQQFTPRVLQTLLQDTITQTVLATFIGAWVYALTAIVLLSTPYFGEREIVALYLTTLGVLVLIVVALMRWILHIQTVGSFVDTVTRIEREVVEAFASQPPACAGAPEAAPDAAGFEDVAERTGFVRSVDVLAIQEAAEAAGARVVVVVAPGDFVGAGDAVARGSVRSAALSSAVRGAVAIGSLRSARQDPGFGLVRLSEIASKALSPAVNDPGTAIDVVGRLAGLLAGWRDGSADRPPLDRVWIRPLDLEGLVADAFDPLARDGATLVEVQVAIQDRLAVIARRGAAPVAVAARRAAERARDRAARALGAPDDLARLEAAAAWLRG